MEQEATYIGIDVAKFRVGRGDSPRRRRLACRLRRVRHRVADSPTATPESGGSAAGGTGGIDVPLVSALAAASLLVVVVNPR